MGKLTIAQLKLDPKRANKPVCANATLYGPRDAVTASYSLCAPLQRRCPLANVTHSVVFLKTYKTGGSTFANVLQRYARNRARMHKMAAMLERLSGVDDGLLDGVREIEAQFHLDWGTQADTNRYCRIEDLLRRRGFALAYRHPFLWERWRNERKLWLHHRHDHESKRTGGSGF